MKILSYFGTRLGVAALALTALVGSLLVLPASPVWASSGGTTTKESCTSSNAPTFNGGSGTVGDPWLISSLGNLETLEECVRNNNSTRNLSTAHYLQTVDISGGTLTPIGTSSLLPFRAKYDGGNFAVYGLVLTPSSGTVAGLFGWGVDCSVTNLTVSGSLTRTAGPADLGLVMGYGGGCTLDNVTAHGTVTSSGTGDPDVGGIIGHANNTTIKNSVSHVDVEAVGRYVGGAVGFLDQNSSMTDVDVRPGQVSVSPVQRGSVKNTACGSRYGGAIGLARGSDVLRVSSSVRVEAEYTGCADTDALRGGGLIGEALLLSGQGSIQNSSSAGDVVVTEVNRLRVVGV